MPLTRVVIDCSTGEEIVEEFTAEEEAAYLAESAVNEEARAAKEATRADTADRLTELRAKAALGTLTAAEIAEAVSVWLTT